MHSAARLLEDELYKEAFQVIEANIVAQLAQPGTPPEKVTELHYSLVALHRIRRYMEQVITTGKLEQMTQARKR